MLDNIIRGCQPPLNYFIMHYWLKFFNYGDYFIDLPSCLFGTLTVLSTYFFAKEMFNKKIAVLSSLFVTFSPLAILFSKEARPYSLLILLTTLLMFYFYKLIAGRVIKKF